MDRVSLLRPVVQNSVETPTRSFVSSDVRGRPYVRILPPAAICTPRVCRDVFLRKGELDTPILLILTPYRRVSERNWTSHAYVSTTSQFRHHGVHDFRSSTTSQFRHRVWFLVTCPHVCRTWVHFRDVSLRRS